MHHTTNNRLLLLAHAWCPRGGVGTRRWSKLAKYLSQNGVHVDVVTSQYPYADKVNWCHDISNNPLIVAHPTKGGYPPYLLKPARGFVTKAGSRILKRTTHPIDAAQGWSSTMHRKCTELLNKHKYDAVILTVGPFSPLLKLPQLKEQFPDVCFVVDYRDPWSYYQKASDASSPAGIVAREYAALQQMDQVWVTTTDHQKAYADKFPLIADKLRVLSNGYDPEDITGVQESKPSEDYWVAIHPGSLAGKRQTSLFFLLSALSKNDLPILREKFRIHLYTNTAISVETVPNDLQAAYDHYVTILHPVPAEEMLQLISNASFAIVFDDPAHTLTLPSKTFEYLALDKKILYIGPEKEIFQQLYAEGHYQARVNEASVSEMLIRLAKEEVSGKTKSGSDLKEQFRIDRLTRQLLSFF
ncbi:glycosyltransferase [Neolewinella persica]|uniref:glycosyltransferase n=1 Tax=Neolewinella persica TaxID=70998 RepID=UPI0003A2B445|nr:glycosyltransferase [Neolewinella persica]